MVSFIAFAEITGAVLAAFALAVGLEWMGLNGLIRFMRRAAQSARALRSVEEGKRITGSLERA